VITKSHFAFNYIQKLYLILKHLVWLSILT